MSLINQVLNDLKKRGSGVSGAGASVRPVAANARQNMRTGALIGIAVLAAALAGAYWYMQDEEDSSPPPVVAKPGPRAAPKPASAVAASAIAAASQPVSSVMTPSAVQAATASAVLAQSAPAPHAQSAVALNSVPAASDSLPLQASVELPAQPAATPGPAAKQHHGIPAGKGKSKPAQPAHEPQKKTPARTAATADSKESADASIKHMSPQQQADGEFNQAAELIRQGRGDAARPHLESALQFNPAHAQARLVLATLLISSKRTTDAEALLQEGVRLDPAQTRLSMLLARIYVDRASLPQATEMLRKSLPYAEDQADYQAFMAAVLQRQNLHEEAVARYQAALRLSPNTGVWWMGMGISLQALKHNEDAREAYKRALGSGSLSAELQDYVKRKMKEL